jgi:hypothetical protein
MGDQPAARPLPTHIITQKQNKRIQRSIHQVSFEPTIPVFERSKTVHVLDRAATVIVKCSLNLHKIQRSYSNKIIQKKVFSSTSQE